MSALPKYAVIFQQLHQALERGTYRPGDRLPSETALGRKFRASRPTVAQGLRELQRLGLIERRAGAGTFVRPPEPVTAGTLGLIADGLATTEIVEPIAVELARAARARGWHVLRGAAIADRDADQVAREWKARAAAGVFLAPLEHHPVRAAFNQALAERLRAQGIAVVLLDRDLAEFPEHSGHDLVAIDDFFAGFDLAAHLLDRGARRLAFVARPAFPSTTDLRLAGARTAAGRVEGADLAFCVGSPADDRFVRTLLRRHHCDGIICANDATAAELMQSLQRLGRRVPHEVRVAGFDDIRYAKLLVPPLTTMRQPCAELGAAAVETMLSRLADRHAPSRRVLLRAELVVRASTGTGAAQG